VIDDVLAQPHQIGDALWRFEAAGIAGDEAPGGLVVCGMGGSAIGGDLAAAAIGARALRPIRTVRGYAPGAGVGPDTLVLCSSYSGTTEETLACFAAAGAAGARRAVVTTGGQLAERARAGGVPVVGVPSGMQPRAGIVYMTVGALECAARCGATPSLRAEIEGAASVLEDVARTAGGDDVARALDGSVPVVYGAGPTAAVARRWKTQLNENAKLPAFASELPEADHNEVEGWRRGLDLASFAAVFLHAPGMDPRLERRLELTAELVADAGATVVRIDARGDSPVAHVLSLVMIGDLVSLSLAELGGVDPDAIDAIEGLKDALGRPPPAPEP
jgi:glucose/mannose-6-phosphate isomerase